MKRNRIIYAILWILSLAGISFFGGAVSYGIFYMLTFLPFVLLLYLLFVYFFFHIYQQIGNKRLVAGHMEPFYFTLKNEYHFGFCSIKIGGFCNVDKSKITFILRHVAITSVAVTQMMVGVP